MSVLDFPPRPEGEKVDSAPFRLWMDRIRRWLCIDDHIELTTLAAGDEFLVFDSSANSTRKVTWTNLMGAVTSSPLTMSTARLLGRTTAGTGAIEQITVGSGLSLSAGALTATSTATQVVVQVFTSSGDYTPTVGMDYCWVRCQAPGGGSGGADMGTISGAAGGGGGGEYAEGVFTAATIGASQTVTIGAIGTAGAAANGTNGGLAGTNSLGALLTCIGGSGGTGTGANSGSQAPRAGGAGGTGGTGGDFRVAGGRGWPGIVFDINATTTDELMAGSGGDSVLGAGARGTTTIDAAGTVGQDYGGGASGATEDDTTGQAGAAGGAGIIIVVEFV